MPATPERNLDTLERYLLRGEKIVVARHRHWATVAEPVALAVVGLVIALWLSASLDANAMQLGDLVWWLWFALAGRAAFHLWEWQREWFIATDRRLLLVYGFIVRKVDMMPLGKVTDMTYHRTVLGRIFGYGTFVLESAGQDQALSNLNFIPQPDETYKSIIAQIFHKEGDDDVDGPDEDYLDEILNEDDEGRRRFFARHLRRFVARDRDRDDYDDLDETGPIQELRPPREASAGRRSDSSGRRGRTTRAPRRHDDDYADEYDEAYETTSLDLGNVAASGGQTIYRSTDGDGTDEPYYPSR